MWKKVGVDMLKIKDSVDLKELYNFGFYKSGSVYQKNLEIDTTTTLFDAIDICIYIVETERIIRFSAHDKRETIKLDVLYDLIKADLVEKV